MVLVKRIRRRPFIYTFWLFLLFLLPIFVATFHTMVVIRPSSNAFAIICGGVSVIDSGDSAYIVAKGEVCLLPVKRVHRNELIPIMLPQTGKLGFWIPLSMPYLLLLFSATFLFWKPTKRHRPGFCSQCGYDLTGNKSGVCPECGERVSNPAQPKSGSM